MFFIFFILYIVIYSILILAFNHFSYQEHDIYVLLQIEQIKMQKKIYNQNIEINEKLQKLLSKK